jgi:uncharacterized protein YndB with AHSA1/START domain
MYNDALATTQVTRLIHAPRDAVYRACVDPDALAAWRVPDNMSAEVHEFEARQGGRFRMSLSYDDPERSGAGKTTDRTDTFQGRFVELVPGERIVEVIEFESADPSFAGEMRMTTSLADAHDGTSVTVLSEDIPRGIRPEDNEEGTRQALDKLAALVGDLADP